ncbi:hypothetical protein BUALT_Bualt01G0184100 [Buddleja alternifolia]|uniref:Uncharacterized protein n=1 Tax=Buddleja alternifolia TaxID=168488 RepID=A0AAV6Y970_9LAMI|nr:hypothetical protein BUALT_Bualt01G0184100 [Buddleja alternifolia]
MILIMFTDSNNNGFPKCMKIVDLGCASGPNTLLVISHIMDTIQELYRQNKVESKLPEFEVFLNDLPNNDFNNLFKLLPIFCKENLSKSRQCFISGSPGSFYGRLFPAKSLHFAYSSYSLHWLSQIPERLEKNNKENIYMAMTSPAQVYEAYGKQYQKDFSRFLSLRSEEIIPGGRMVLTFIGRCFADPSSKDVCAIFTLLSETLLDLVAEGLVKEEDLYSFNVPVYMPCQQEVEAIITNEGSFNLDEMETFLVPWDANGDDSEDLAFDKHRSGKFVSDCVRAFMEPMLSSHFGNSINIDGLFDRYAEKMAEHLSIERPKYFTILLSLSRR